MYTYIYIYIYIYTYIHVYIHVSNSISTSVAEWYKASVVRKFLGTATWVRFPPPVKGLRS